MKRLALLPLTFLTMAAAQAPTTVTGIPTVTDGDTLVIRGVKVRLHGVDAPESSQTCTRAGRAYGCGREAAFALADLVANKTVTCVRRDTDRYGRMVGVCRVGETEINRAMVTQGWALPYLQYGGQVYVSAAQAAQAARRGLWSGAFQNPWEYRRAPGSPATAGTPRAGGTAPATGAFPNCAAARAAGKAPLLRGQPGYSAALDRDGDGRACE